MAKMDHHYRLRGFKLTNSMSFGESVLSAGFNQKTTKEDIFIKGKYRIPLCKQRGKTLEDSWRLSTEAEPVPLHMGLARPHL